MASNTALTGSAGVHYLAFELAIRGYAVGLTAPGVKGIDILAGDPETGSSVSIQVKTMTNAHVDIGKPRERWKWRVGKQLGQGQGHKDLLVAFVDMCGGVQAPAGNSCRPDVFIVPSPLPGRLLWPYPEDASEPVDYWFVIPARQADKYRNRWDRIDTALS